uniref:GPI alpha-1,4-mannosyltransferase I, catalytic subunit n=2 Tax=Onchocerca TaxID=6281 RepID=A0A8R1TKY9_ONCVO
MESKKQRNSGKQTLEVIETPENMWKWEQILLLSFLCRMILVCYGHIHDYIFEVHFTDIDYKVYSDAAEYVYHGRSPYERATYRYTPLLAWLLTPVLKWPDFGKILFCILDVAVGFLYFKLSACSSTIRKNEDESRMRKSVVIFWLANPLTAIISSRGNADVLVCAAVLWTLYLLTRKQWCLAAIIYGSLAIHLKLYPIIYLPSIFLFLSNVSLYCGWIDYGKRLILNVKGYIFILIFSSSLLALMAVYYMLYGMPYINEAFLYHLHRTDTRHNFSPYFYMLYLAANDMQLSRLISFCCFIPQALLIIWLAFRFHDDLPFCWLLTTAVFVSFNKACTSQYFIWYICLLPIAQQNIEMSTKAAMYLIILWFLGQIFWLYPAYLFEFRGLNTFCLIWLSSLLFLIINTAIIVQLIRHHHSKRIVCWDRAEHYCIAMLYLIGLGLGNVDDITVKGMAIVQKCSRVYLETYTSIMSFGLHKEKLEEFFGKEIEEADRATVELDFNSILNEAHDSDICLLVVGDPLGATTHADLVLTARKANINVEIVHNASIISAVGCCGLQLYRFGEIVSIVFWEKNWRPDSYYFKIAENKKRGLHTLCLLDIKTKEQSVENMMKGRKEFLPPKYMTCSEAAKQLLEIVNQITEERLEPAYMPSTECVALARIGWDDQKIVFCSLKALCDVDMGPPLHSLIIPGDLHPIELDFLKSFPTS